MGKFPYVLVVLSSPIDRQFIYAKQGETFDYTDATDTKGVRSWALIPVREEITLRSCEQFTVTVEKTVQYDDENASGPSSQPNSPAIMEMRHTEAV